MKIASHKLVSHSQLLSARYCLCSLRHCLRSDRSDYYG
jgi:hypothetical protein